VLYVLKSVDIDKL